MSDRSAIPDVPRAVRWRPCLRRNWVLGLIGGLMLANALILMLILQATTGSLLPFDDMALDRGASRATARVLAVDATSAHENGRPVWAIRYEFMDLEGQRRSGTSYSPSPEIAQGGEVEAEFLAYDPEVHRLRGTLLAPFPLAAILCTTMAALGLAMLLVWLRGVVRLRVLMREGAVGLARLQAVKPTRYVNPPQVRVEYELRVPGGTVAGSHWVARASELGRELLAGAGTCPAVFDDGDPTLNRLVHVSDFEGT